MREFQLSVCRKLNEGQKSFKDEDAVKHVLDGFNAVEPYDDMASALRTLHKAGIRVRCMALFSILLEVIHPYYFW